MARVCRYLFPLLMVVAATKPESAAGAETYQLIGQIRMDEQEFSRRALPLVLLEGTKVPFAARTNADWSGKFKFKNLHPDLFTLIVYIPRAGEHRQTVEVSSGLADSKKRVHVEVSFRPNLASMNLRKVSSVQLSIPEKARKEFSKATQKLGKRDLEGAIAHLNKAVGIAPQFTDAWNTLGTLAYKMKEYALAESHFREALKHDPDYYPSMVNLGGVLLTMGKLQEALPLNTAAVVERPDDALAHAQLGLNYYHLGQLSEAEKYLKQAIALDPGHFSFPHLPLADIYFRREDFGSAALLYEQFLALHPDAPQSPSVLARLKTLRGTLRGRTRTK